ncbi:MAG TPA: hypothetical protein VMM84_11185 [Pyrinomonadaceae bacterium]|nr:hypothetical protein [Pyrinomonadaceae bacterium]
MILSLGLALLVTASGTLVTYLYDIRVSLPARVAAGSCVGLATLGLLSFLIACLIGLTPLAIIVTAAFLATPFMVLLRPDLRDEVHRDLAVTLKILEHAIKRPTRIAAGYVFFYAATTTILWQAFSRAMIETPEGIYTGLLNNFGDLPFHLSVITSFAFGENFPPESPAYAGVKFTYPFISDLISAIFVRTGATLAQSMFIANMILVVSFVGLLHRWAFEMLRDRLAAIITPLLVLLNGGFGWVLLWSDGKWKEEGLLGVLHNLPPSVTVIPETTWRWGNAISTLLIPQRGMLLGLPLAVIVFTQWWLATSESQTGSDVEAGQTRSGKRKKARKSGKKQDPVPTYTSTRVIPPIRRMIAAGLVAGLLPLVHAHSFLVVMTVAGCLVLLQRRWREWIAFFLAALVIASPQLLWSTQGSAVDATKFFEWHFGWDRGESSAFWFWLKNTGLFIPLLILALLWRGRRPIVPRQVLIFYLPFTLCFIVPNVVKLAPWVWDNIKVLYYWWLASAPLVALLLARLWHQGKAPAVLAVFLFCFITLAGALDVAGIVLKSNMYQIFDRQGLEFAELVKEQTPPRALIVHAPVHNHPVFLTGRRSLMGYPGHVWTHGLDFVQREGEIKRMFAGASGATGLLKKYAIDYAVLGPQEKNVLNVNEAFFLSFRKVGEAGAYRLYKISPP